MNTFDKKIILIFLVLATLLAGGLIYWGRINKKNNQEIENIQTQQNNNTTVFIRKTAPKDDKDNDGLTDVDEAKLGTSTSTSDTDYDGLEDELEANVYNTNPQKADTDGDGFGDGMEIMKGYNPNGSGKLQTSTP